MAVIINGVRISGGNNITIRNGRVIVDGADVTPSDKQINIAVQGNVTRLEVDCCDRIGIAGSAGAVSTQSGDVEVRGDITGSVNTMSGSVECGGSISGNVSTMSGSVRHR